MEDEEVVNDIVTPVVKMLERATRLLGFLSCLLEALSGMGAEALDREAVKRAIKMLKEGPNAPKSDTGVVNFE